jgi:hypothetical protein
MTLCRADIVPFLSDFRSGLEKWLYVGGGIKKWLYVGPTLCLSLCRNKKTDTTSADVMSFFNVGDKKMTQCRADIVSFFSDIKSENFKKKISGKK